MKRKKSAHGKQYEFTIYLNGQWRWILSPHETRHKTAEHYGIDRKDAWPGWRKDRPDGSRKL